MMTFLCNCLHICIGVSLLHVKTITIAFHAVIELLILVPIKAFFQTFVLL